MDPPHPTKAIQSINLHDINGRYPADTIAEQYANSGETIPAGDTGNDWFSKPIRQLFGRKSGILLHAITGFGERNCHRYAAGHLRPPGYLIRALLRSEQGFQFLQILMDGSEPRWWRDLERARRLAAAIDREV